jgi:drug/metabolite transporter (DMT)-like permease
MNTRAVVRGVVAGLSGVGFVLIFLFAQTRLVSLPVLLGIGIATIIALFAAGGTTAVRRLAGRTETTTDEKRETDWWLTRVEPALEDSWNAWSDLVLAVCLGAVGIGSFALLVTSPSDDPPLGLLITGFLGINGALISLAFALD